MKGIWDSAKWELREIGILNWKTAVVMGVWLIYDLNAARSWFGLGAAAYMSLHLLAFVGVAVCQGVRWPFTGAFDLERTSGRPAWQSVLGRTLAWTAVIALGSALQQIFFRVHLGRFGALYPQLFSDGAERVARLEAWTGGAGFLTVLLLGVGLYVLALAVALCCKSGKKRHRATMSAAVAWLLIAVVLGYIIFRDLPLGFVGLGVILTGLPLSIWLLANKVE